jgi:biotin carboxylase
MKPRMMMIGGRTEIYQKAQACGFDLTVVQDKSRINAVDMDFIDQLITAPIDDPVLVDLATVLHRAKPFESVLSFQEFGVMNAALIRESLGLFGNPLRPVTLTRDKGRMRAHLHTAGISTVPYLLSNSAREIMSFAEEVGWPIILKPRDGGGSRLVYKVSGSSELDRALAHIFAIDPHVELIAEQFMVGPEVSAEALTWEGKHQILMVTDKLTTGEPHFVEMGHDMPSRLEPDQLAQIQQLTTAFLDSIGHMYGPSHTEIILTENGPTIVESHTRTGGDQIFELLEIVTGVDIFSAVLRGFMGDYPWPLPNGRIRAASIRFLDLKPGVIAHFSGLEEARCSPGVLRVESQICPGSTIVPILDSLTRPGYVLAAGGSTDEAARAAEDAARKIHVRVE